MRLQDPALRLDGRPIAVAEVLAASLLGGFGSSLVQRVADGLAAVELAAQRDLATTGAEVQEALDRWRIERDLIAGDEFRSWMEAAGLDLERVAAWLDRELLRERLSSSSRAALDARQPALSAVVPLLHESALLGHELAGLSEQLALRLVAPAPDQAGDGDLAAARAGLFGSLGCESSEQAAALLQELGVEEARLSRLADAELAYRFVRHHLGRDESLQQELREHRDELVRFEVADASFANEDVAREVLCCVREDGDTFRRSSSRAGEHCSSESLLALELSGRRFGNRLLAAKAREVFGPAESEGRHHLAQLVRKIEPDLRSERVRDELTDRIVRRALKSALIDRVVFAAEDAA